MNNFCKTYIAFTLLTILFSHSHVYCQSNDTVQLESMQDFENINNSVRDLTNSAIQDISLNDSNEALRKLNEAMKIDSNYRQIYIQLYQVWLLNQEKFNSIPQTLKNATKIFREDDELHFYCAEIYRIKLQLDSSIIEYSKAIEYSKINGEKFYLVPYYYFNRGNCYLKQNKIMSALDDYNDLISISPDFSAGLTNRGICYYQLGKIDEACSDWKSAIDKGYNPANQYYNKYCQKNQ